MTRDITELAHLRDNVYPDTLQELDNANATITELRAQLADAEAVIDLMKSSANYGPLVEARATIDRLTAEAAHLGERLAEADHMAKLMYLQSERWHEMAETLHEELIEWHNEDCPCWSDGSDARAADCVCHALIEARWTELVEGNQ